MALIYLVDTSVIKRIRTGSVRQRIEPLAAIGAIARPTICDLEVGYSARIAAECDALRSSLEAFEVIKTSTGHIRRALPVQRLLAARSQRGRKIPDLLVAPAAESLDLTVLHFDADFDQIAAVTRQRREWVVAPGTVD